MAKKTIQRTDDPNNLLERAYSLASVEEALILYQDWAVSYDRHLEGQLKYIAPLTIVNIFSDRQSTQDLCVLDVGCGTGLVGAQLVKHNFHCIDGLDLSGDMLSEARNKGIYRHLFEMDLNKALTVGKSSYEAAISCGTFTHGHVGADAFQRVLELLKLNGIFACTIHKEVWLSAGFSHLFEELCSAGKMEVELIYSLPFFANSPSDGYYCVVRRIS